MARKSKFDTAELKDIIHKFLQEEEHKVANLNFSNLARFAQQDLGLGGIKYYHFSRNKEINSMIKEYDKTLKSDTLEDLSNNNSFSTLNIKEFVKMNAGKPDKLTFFLSQLQEGQKKLYDRTVRAEFDVKQLKNVNEELKGINKRYKNRYNDLKGEFDKLKEHSLALAESLDLKEEKQFISALKSVDIIEYDSEDASLEKEDISSLEEQKDFEKLIDDYSDIFD